MNKLSYLATLLASAAVGTQAQDRMCLCSPTIFNFVIDLSEAATTSVDGKCAFNSIESNPGVQVSLCFQEDVDALPGQPANGEPTRRKLQAEKIVEVVSLQFLEFNLDGDMTVGQQDDTYINTVLQDGAAVQFYSASSLLNTSVPLADQTGHPFMVPGGASLILYGKTESGKVVRNRFFWLYDMYDCGRDNNPVQVGNQIGWVKVVSLSFFMCFVYIFVVLYQPLNFHFFAYITTGT